MEDESLPFNFRFAMALCAKIKQEHRDASVGSEVWIGRSCALAMAAYADMRPIEVGVKAAELMSRVELEDFLIQARLHPSHEGKKNWLRCMPGFSGAYLKPSSTMAYEDVPETSKDSNGYAQMVFNEKMLMGVERAVRALESSFGSLHLSLFDQGLDALEVQIVKNALDAEALPGSASASSSSLRI